MGRQKALKLVGLGIVAALLGACTTIQPIFATSSFDPTTMEVIGPAKATVDRMYTLGFGPSGGDTELAIAASDKAAKSVGGDALINVTADDQKTYVLPFIYTHTLTVQGLAVKYKKR